MLGVVLMIGFVACVAWAGWRLLMWFRHVYVPLWMQWYPRYRQGERQINGVWVKPRRPRGGAAGFDPKRMAELAGRFPIGTRVRYVGTRAKRHHGKTGTVVSYVDANGLKLLYDDGSSGTCTPENVEIV